MKILQVNMCVFVCVCVLKNLFVGPKRERINLSKDIEIVIYCSKIIYGHMIYSESRHTT